MRDSHFPFCKTNGTQWYTIVVRCTITHTARCSTVTVPPEHTFKVITVREKRVRHTVNIYPQTSKTAITRLSARQFEKFPLKLELNGSPRAQNTLGWTHSLVCLWVCLHAVCNLSSSN